MTTLTIDDIRAHLHRFEESVKDLRNHIHELKRPGKFPVSTPLVEKNRIAEFLESSGLDEKTRQAFHDTYMQIASDFAVLEHAGGRAYRDLVYCDLCTFVDRYAAAISLHELSLCDAVEDRDLFMREEIGVLLLELQPDYDLADIQRKVAALDEAMEGITRGTDGRIEKTDTPDEKAAWYSRSPDTCCSDLSRKFRAGTL